MATRSETPSSHIKEVSSEHEEPKNIPNPEFQEVVDFSFIGGVKYYETICKEGATLKRYYVKLSSMDPHRGVPMALSFDNGVKAGELHQQNVAIIYQNVCWRSDSEACHSQINAIHDVEIQWQKNGDPFFKAFLIEWREEPHKRVWIKEQLLKPDPSTGEGGFTEIVRSFLRGFIIGYKPK